MNDAVSAALAAAFPDRSVEAVAPAAGSAHPGNETAHVRFAGGEEAFLEVAADGRGERVAREAAAARYAAGYCDVRVPAVLAADAAHDPPYVATARLAGTPVADRWDGADADARAEPVRTVGRAVAGVHAARFDRAGRVVGGDGDRLQLDEGAWSDVLAATLAEREAVHFADRFPDVPGRVRRAVRDRRSLLDGAPAALLHDDPRPDNCLASRDGPGLVDWERALVGDPALGVCRAEAQYVDRPGVGGENPERLRTALRAGYRDRAGDLPAGFDERRPVYRLVTFLPVARTFDLWAPAADEPVGELAAWVRGEVDRRIEGL